MHRFDLDACCVYLPRCSGRPAVAALEGTAVGSAYAPQAAADAALSEYVERRHFRYRIPDAGPLHLENTDALTGRLEAFYRQTSRSPALEIPGELPSCWVLRWRDWAPVRIPRNLVGLGYSESVQEFGLNPHRDSGGMACHRSDMQALESAVLEFVERQTWLAWWLGGGSAYRIDPAVFAGLTGLAKRDVPWSAVLLNAGLGAYTVLVAGHSEDCSVCATASRLDAGLALQKALLEADHFRAFLGDKRLAVRAGQARSRFEKSAVEYSSQGVPDRVAQALMTAPMLNATEFAELPRQDLALVRECVDAISPHAYVYLAQEISLFGRHSIARLVSPDFYANGDPGVDLNYDNPFAARLGIADPPLEFRTSTCLP